jgi:predicted nucleic acid-binding protein
LDTDILSEYLKGYDTTVAGHAAVYAQEHGVFTFTSVTVYEIAFGLELKGATAQLQKALAWLDPNEQITPVNADYLAATTIRATARRQGSPWNSRSALLRPSLSGYRFPLSRETPKISRPLKGLRLDSGLRTGESRKLPE